MHKCKECEKEFDADESFKNHMRDKHHISDKKRLKIKKSYVVSGFVFLIFLGFIAFSIISINKPGELDDFAKCLTEKNATFYGAFWCQHCAEQKVLFGKSVKFVNYVECSTPDKKGQTQICIIENIESYPTWKFNDGTKVQGVLPIEDLSERSGCELKND